jgi:hypothetical protein
MPGALTVAVTSPGVSLTTIRKLRPASVRLWRRRTPPAGSATDARSEEVTLREASTSWSAASSLMRDLRSEKKGDGLRV